MIDKFLNLQEKRCAKCPAAWSECDYWGEYDEGCYLNKDCYDFCKYAFAPHWFIKFLMAIEKRHECRRWSPYENEMNQEDILRKCIDEAVIETLSNYQIIDCFERVVDLKEDGTISYEIATGYISRLHDVKREVQHEQRKG